MDPAKLRLELIDSMIHYWRGRRNGAEGAQDELIACCHVEAFQLVRILHGYPLLPEREEPPPTAACDGTRRS